MSANPTPHAGNARVNAGQAAPSHAGHAHGAHGGAPSHGTRKSYLIGFLLSVVLTAVPFGLVMTSAAAPQTLALVAIACAVVQIVVHTIYFLHVNTQSEGGWTMLALIFTTVMVVLVISGSLWIMYHLNSNMMPMAPGAMPPAP